MDDYEARRYILSQLEKEKCITDAYLIQLLGNDETVNIRIRAELIEKGLVVRNDGDLKLIEMPEEKDIQQRDIFISYSNADYDVASNICNWMEKQEYTCWIAPRNIPAGAIWGENILNGIANCKVVLLVLSSQSNVSKWVLREVDLALQYQKEIIPFRIEDIQPTGLMKFYLATIQILNALPPPVKNYFWNLESSIRNIVHQNLALPNEPRGTISVNPESINLDVRTLKKIPIFSASERFSFISTFYHSFSQPVPQPLLGAIVAFGISFVLFFGFLLISHRMVGTPSPANFPAWFRVASGERFYYPDINALFFDAFLHPAMMATLVYFSLFMLTKENTYFLRGNRFFIPETSLAKKLIKSINFLFLEGFPIFIGLFSIYFVYIQRYSLYGMKQPLLTVALLTIGLSFYCMVALLTHAIYMVLILAPPEAEKISDDKIGKEQAVSYGKVIARLSVIFIYVILLSLIDAFFQCLVSGYKGAGFDDFIRSGTLFVAILSTIVLLSATFRFWMPVFNRNLRTSIQRLTFWGCLSQGEITSLVLLLYPIILIILSFLVFIEIHR